MSCVVYPDGNSLLQKAVCKVYWYIFYPLSIILAAIVICEISKYHFYLYIHSYIWMPSNIYLIAEVVIELKTKKKIKRNEKKEKFIDSA